MPEGCAPDPHLSPNKFGSTGRFAPWETRPVALFQFVYFLALACTKLSRARAAGTAPGQEGSQEPRKRPRSLTNPFYSWFHGILLKGSDGLNSNAHELAARSRL
jgi:hypothetical protein